MGRIATTVIVCFVLVILADVVDYISASCDNRTLVRGKTSRSCDGSHASFWSERTMPLTSASCHSDRARAAAMMLTRAKLFDIPSLRVLDLGSGCGHLRKYLRTSDAYVPSDVVSRDFPVLECDFNAGEFPTVNNVSVVVALGVLEYMCDVDHFLRAVATYNAPSVVSYTPASWFDVERTVELANRLTSDDLKRSIHRAGMTVLFESRVHVRYGAYKMPNTLYYLVPQPSSPSPATRRYFRAIVT